MLRIPGATLAAAAGSAVGAILRYAASQALPPTDPAFPWATLLVNVLGSFVIGFYATLSGPEGPLVEAPRQRVFVMTGLCGGLTTFSVFSLETVLLLQNGRELVAAANIVVSLLLWVPGAWAGHLSARRLRVPRRETLRP